MQFVRSVLLVMILWVLATTKVAAQHSSDSFVDGAVIDTVRCLANARQSYAVYLPQNYTTSAAWPVVIFFDPAGRGKLPVKNYQSLAETFQCVLVGSNNARNGPIDVTIESEEAIWNDVTSRLAIDKTRALISGFSGGARASVYLYRQSHAYSGIIACGAAFLPGDKLTSTDSGPFIELVGNRDMNFTEGLDVDRYLSSIRYPHALLLFEGPHDWPPVREYGMALYWQFVAQAQKAGTQVTDSLTNRQAIVIEKMVRQLLDSGDYYFAYRNLTNLMATYPGSKIRLTALQNDVKDKPETSRQQIDLQKAVEAEEKVKHEFSERYSTFLYAKADSAFHQPEWKAFIDQLRHQVRSKRRQESLMASRAMDWMTISSHGEYRTFMQSGDYLHATFAAKLLTMLSNLYTNHILLARAYAAGHREALAISSLRKAKELGLKSRREIEGDRFLITLKEKRGYDEIVQGLAD